MKSENLIISENSIILKIILTTVLILLGIGFYIFSPIVSFVLFIVALALLFHSQGMEIDSNKNTFRYYNSFASKKSGKWHSLDLYHAIIIITTKGKKRAHHMTSERNVNTTGLIHKVFLVDKNHKNRLLVIRTEDDDKVSLIIEQLKTKLNLPFQKYNPTFSQKTMERRQSGIKK